MWIVLKFIKSKLQKAIIDCVKTTPLRKNTTLLFIKSNSHAFANFFKLLSKLVNSRELLFMNNNVVFFLKCVVMTQPMIAFCNFDPLNAKINHFDRFKLFRKVKNESQTQENL